MKRRRWWLLAAGGVGVAALVGAGAVMAQTPAPGSSGGTTFLDRVAQKLGIQSSKLQDAVTSAANDQIDAEVQSGKLSQAQADKLKQRIADGQVPWLNGPFPGKGEGGREFGLGFGKLGADASKLAGFLGISTDQLKTELQANNATLATVAQAHGKSRDQLKTFITDTVKSQLDQAVTNKKLTQQQADTALSTLQSHLDQLIDAHMPHLGGPMHGMWGGRDKPSPGTPSAPTTPGAGAGFQGSPFGSPMTSAAFRG